MTSQNFEVAGAKGSHPTAKLEIEIKVCVVDMPPPHPGWIKKKLVTDSVFLVLPTRIQWWIVGGGWHVQNFVMQFCHCHVLPFHTNAWLVMY